MYIGISYKLPNVCLVASTPMVLVELAGRTAYQSFDKSEHSVVRGFAQDPYYLGYNEDVEDSALAMELSHVYHHTSTLEHVNLSFKISDVGRGVLQELVRHRIGVAYTVKSTRYTGSSILNAFNASNDSFETFKGLLPKDMLIVEGWAADLEYKHLWEKLVQMEGNTPYMEDWLKLTMSKSQLDYWVQCAEASPEDRFNELQLCKQKRNVYDPFKWTVTDNWSTEIFWTVNLRALGHFIGLRYSGAAWFQIENLASKIIEDTPMKYLKLCLKPSVLSKIVEGKQNKLKY